MTFLFDVNVLLASMDGQHVAHGTVHEWIKRTGVSAWATCPITQNGFIRIISNPKYTNPTRSLAKAVELLADSCSTQGHVFWPDDLSIIVPDMIRSSRLLSHAQVTDTYLLALAKRHCGKLATLDRRLVVDAVEDGAASLHLIGYPAN